MVEVFVRTAFPEQLFSEVHVPVLIAVVLLHFSLAENQCCGSKTVFFLLSKSYFSLSFSFADPDPT
jgi:hypothetical protein